MSMVASSSARPVRATRKRGAVLEVQSCPGCGPSRRRTDGSEVWVECERCETWYHWACAAKNPLDQLDQVENWFCPPCIAAAPTTLSTTFKNALRKSSRDAVRIDYANFASHLPADPGRWARVLATRAVTEHAFRRYDAAQITREWLYTSPESMQEPFWVAEPIGLDMHMPDSSITIHAIAQIVGPSTKIEVIDVASQSSLAHWTLAQWAAYYDDANRDKVRNVISLEVSNSPLAAQVVPPALVRELDWVEQFWPASMKAPGMSPQVMKYCLMSVASCWTDWHVDFAGSSVFYHILRGSKVFYFIRPSPANLLAYERWSGSAELQENTWLGDEADMVYKIELTAGNTMIIPTGWIHAVYTPEDSLVFGGNFLHSLNIATQLEIYRIELATRVPSKFRFPRFITLQWFVAHSYTARLRTPPNPLPLDLSPRVLEGLKTLSAFLIEQTTRLDKAAPVTNERRRIARENVPWEVVPDPVSLAIEFRTVVLRALGEPTDLLCVRPPPPVEIPDVKPPVARSSPSLPSTKRKAQPLEPTRAGLNFRNWTPEAVGTRTPTKRDDGEILERRVEPVVVTLGTKSSVDPRDAAAGEQDAEVKTSTSTTVVVRRFVEDGVAVVETRSVLTTVERVRYTSPSAAATPTLSTAPALP